MSVEKIVRILHRRPPSRRPREQLFWLVDLIYACKSSGDQDLAREAHWVEDALGRLGSFLETGEPHALNDASARVEQFARAVATAAASAKKSNKE